MTIYTKQPYTINDLIKLLQDKSLIILNIEEAEKYLSTIGYSRLSTYFAPFLISNTENFKPNTSFDKIISLYTFDRKLRLLILEAIEQIEVAIRVEISNYLSLTYKDSFWYLNSNFFNDHYIHNQFLHMCYQSAGKNNFFYIDKKTKTEKIKTSAKNKNSELFTFYKKYPNQQLPPSWMIIETLPMGCWSKLYNNLKTINDKRNIAKKFGFLVNDFNSWLQVVTVYRNAVAHHRRFWNESFSSIHPKNIKRYLKNCGGTNDIYLNYLVIYTLLKSVNKNSINWKNNLYQLLLTSPLSIHSYMNFPVGWENLEFWN